MSNPAAGSPGWIGQRGNPRPGWMLNGPLEKAILALEPRQDVDWRNALNAPSVIRAKGVTSVSTAFPRSLRELLR